MQFVKDFLSGRVAPFETPIEDTDAFVELSSMSTERSANIESAVMELAHGSCHALSIALSLGNEETPILVLVNPAGLPIHSGLYNQSRDLVLDANGVHRTEQLVAFWSRIAREPLQQKIMKVEELMFFYDVDDDEIDITLEDFGYVIDFIENDLKRSISEDSELSIQP